MLYIIIMLSKEFILTLKWEGLLQVAALEVGEGSIAILQLFISIKSAYFSQCPLKKQSSLTYDPM